MSRASKALGGTALGQVVEGVTVRATSVQIAVPAAEFDTLLQEFIAGKMGKVKPELIRSINISLEGDEAVFTVTDQPPPPEHPSEEEAQVGG